MLTNALIHPGHSDAKCYIVATPLSNLTTEQRKAMASLKRERDITILLADKGRYTVDNLTKVTDQLTQLSSDVNRGFLWLNSSRQVTKKNNVHLTSTFNIF